jgi:hypothetical protein
MRMAENLVEGALALVVAMIFVANPVMAQNDPAKVAGPNACGECHKNETLVWKGTHHFSTFKNLPRNEKARAIADKMGVRRIKAESLCINCHFTLQTKGSRTRAVAGISCESCHSEGAAWIKQHSSYSGKKKATESAGEAKVRWAKAESMGMIRPANMYELAKNCYSCHVVPQEKLVNVGGHPAGSKFDLVAWSQGEIRHNLWYNDGKENRPGSANRQRIMHVVGVAVELETALRSVGNATQRKAYAVYMARRAAAARAKVTAMAKILSSVPELAQMAKIGNSAGLKLNNGKELNAAADKVAAVTKKLAAKYDGSTFGAVDASLPGADKYKGKPVR